MASAFQPGNVVRLKSGGPKMTVTVAGDNAMTGEPFVHCVWFEGAKKHEASFAPEALEITNGGGHQPQVISKKP